LLETLHKIYNNSPKENLRSILGKVKRLYFKQKYPLKAFDSKMIKGISVKTNAQWKNSYSTNYHELNFTNIELFDKAILNEINKDLEGIIEGTDYLKNEMSYEERAFIHGIVRKTNAKNIVEIGVSAGGSASVILNAIKDNKNAKLFSFDYNTTWYRETDDNCPNKKQTGFLVPQIIPELSPKWSLLTGGMPCKYFHLLPDEGIDICLIDTVHVNPGEHLNILEILPFMKKNGIIIFHDTEFHTLYDTLGTTNCVSLNSLNGKRIVLKNTKNHGLANIGAIILDDNTENMLYSLFSNISLPWAYAISEEDFKTIFKHFLKYYPYDMVMVYLYYSIFYMNGGLNNSKLAVQLAQDTIELFKKDFLSKT